MIDVLWGQYRGGDQRRFGPCISGGWLATDLSPKHRHVVDKIILFVKCMHFFPAIMSQSNYSLIQGLPKIQGNQLFTLQVVKQVPKVRLDYIERVVEVCSGKWLNWPLFWRNSWKSLGQFLLYFCRIMMDHVCQVNTMKWYTQYEYNN